MSTTNAGRNLLSDNYYLDVPTILLFQIMYSESISVWKGEQFSDKVKQMRKEEVSEHGGFK